MIFRNSLSKYLLTTVSAGAMMLHSSAFANPDGATVVVGDVDIVGVGTDHVIVNNGSDRAVVDWENFSIGTGETTTINQNSSNAAILNRVTGGNVTEIYGTLESNGQVFLINENGILVGESGVVETNGAVFSTLDVSNDDFLGGGDMLFTQGIAAGGGIEIHGKIRSVSGGDIFILSREITIGEKGSIDGNGGYVGLGAGEEILLKPVDSGEGRISIRAGKGKITNRGSVEAVAAELKAAGGNEYALAINNTGVVRAKGYSKSGGKIRLGGGGKVRNSGKIVARKKVVVRSKSKIVNSGSINATDGNKGGEIIFEAPEIVVENGSLLDVSGALGGGRMFIGGGYQGTGVDRFGNAVDISENATNVIVESGAVIAANATESGNAGDIVVWADNSTTFAGSLFAESAAGAGGTVEISGKKTLAFNPVSIAMNGETANGELLLDPENINVVTALTAGAENEILDSVIEAALENGASVTLRTSTPDVTGTATPATDLAAGTGPTTDGDVTFEAGVEIVWTDGGDGSDDATTFRVEADRDIIAASDVLIQQSDTGVNGTDEEVGGITFLAGRDILIGSTGATGEVAIGSEHGTTLFKAGVTDFNGDGTIGADGSVTVQGGDTVAASNAQIGYVLDGFRSDTDAANGDIIVLAGGDVEVFGGNALYESFAQIGHGGDVIASTASEVVSSDITVRAGIITTDSKVDLKGGVNSSPQNYAQIGHGSNIYSFDNDLVVSRDIVQRDISGNIVVSSGLSEDGSAVVNTSSTVELNTSGITSANGGGDHIRAKIGHGASVFYEGSGMNGDEVTHGRIDGNIDVTATGDLLLGASVSANTADDRFLISSQVGHGGYTEFVYDGTSVSGDEEFSVIYDNIANFDDLIDNDGGDATTHGTDITIKAASIQLVAIEAVENSADYSGNNFDNMISNQIGHGSTTRYESGATPDVPETSDTALDSTTALPVAQASGAYQEPVEYTDVTTGTGAASGVQVQNLTEAIIDGLSTSEAAALAAFMATNPADTDTVPANVSNVSFTLELTQSSTNVDINALVDAAISCVGGNCTVADLSLVDTTAWTAAEQAALQAFIASAPTTTATTAAQTGSAAATLIDGQLDITIIEGDIAGDIAIYDTDKTDDVGVLLDAGISVGLTAITNDRMTNRIGHATHTYITAHDANDNSDDAGSNDAGTINIDQANILGADILIDTITQGTSDSTADDATEQNDQDIILRTSITAGLAKAELNDATNVIGHGGEIFIISGVGGSTADGNNASGHGGDVNIQRGTVWDGIEYYGNANEASDASYGGSVDITLNSSNQIIIDDDVSAALSKAEANNAISQIGSGALIEVFSGDGGADGTAGLGGRGGDITITWDNDEQRDYGHNDSSYDDYARGIMGNIWISAEHDGALTGTDGGLDGYALDITSDDKAALSKADHNTVIGQIGHGDFFELISGYGGDGGDLDLEDGQSDGGRGGDIAVLFNDNDFGIGDGESINGGNDLNDLKTEGSIVLNIKGAIRGEAVVTNALSPEKHGLVETTIGHGTHVFAVAGDGGDGGEATLENQIVGYDPDTDDEGAFDSANDGLQEATLRDVDGEILRGGSVGGDGGDIHIALGDISERYYIQNDDGDVTYYHDGLYDLRAQYVADDDDLSIERNVISDVVVWATHNENGATGPNTGLEQSVFFHAQVKHALSEGPGSEVNAQIGHQVRVQAQGGLGGDGSSNVFEQVDFSTLQADLSGGNGGDVLVTNGFIKGDVTIEAERQVQFFAEAGHGMETIVTAITGHNTHLVAVTRAGGAGGDLYSGLGNTDNNIQEYWETSGAVENDFANDALSTADATYSITLLVPGATEDDDPVEETQNVSFAGILLDLGLTSTDTISELDGLDLEGLLDEFQLAALTQFIEDRKAAGAPAAAAAPLFELTLQDLNKDDQFSLGDSGSLGTNADVADDDNTFHDDGIGIAIDGNDAVDTDKEVATATHGLLNQQAGIDKDLNEGAVELYRTGVNPDNTVAGASVVSDRTVGVGADIEAALMVYDSDGNPQFIAIEVIDAAGATATGAAIGDVIYVANTAENRVAIDNATVASLEVVSEFSGTEAFQSNVDDSTDNEAEFVYSNDYTSDDDDLDSITGVWTYNENYDAANDSSTDKFTYVDLNLDRQVDLVDFDADGKFDVVDIDQNGVYDRIDGRVGVTAADTIATIGHDDKGNANIIDYASNTGINFDASHTEGGWQVADLSQANGGRGGNATTGTGYIEGNIAVYTGNVNFAADEAYAGAEATGATDSLIVMTDVQDNIVDTGGVEDTVISRIGHGSYQYSDTAGESDDFKVNRTLFITGTDAHGAATGGDAGKHALNASGGDGGDAESILGSSRAIALTADGDITHVEIDHLVGDIAINTRMSLTDNTHLGGGFAFVADPKGDGTSLDKDENESTANRVVVSSKVDNALGGNIGIAQIGHGAISITDATFAQGGDGESGNGSEIEAHQTEIANGGVGGSANSVAHHVKGDIEIYAGRAPDPADEVTSIVLSAEEGPRIVPGSNGDIVVAQFGHGRIGYAGSGAGGESDDAQWKANGGDGGDAITIQRDILDTSIVVNSSDLFGHGMDVLASAYQGSNHIVRAQIGQGDINFAESNAGGDAAPSKSSVVEQWNQEANGGRGGDAIALQAGYNYDITVDVGSAPDTSDADKASLRIVTDAQNIFLGTQNHILATIGHGGYSHAESSSASGGLGSYRSALGGISVGDSETPFSTYVSHREGGRGGNAISEIGINGTGRDISGRDDLASYHDAYLADDDNGADIIALTHDRSYDSALYSGVETFFNYGNTFIEDLGGGQNSYRTPDGDIITTPSSAGLNIDIHDTDTASAYYARYDGILVLSQAGPGDNHTRAVDTNTSQIGHSGFNRADALAGEGINGDLMFGRIAPTNADGGHGIQSIFSANIQEGDGGNGGDAFAYTGSVDGDIVVSNTFENEANDTGSTIANNVDVLDGTIPDEDGDTNITFRATGGTVSGDHRVDARAGHNVASEAVTDSNGGNAARPPQPVISFIAAVSSHAGAAGDASSIQGALSGDITIVAENSIILESKKTTLSGDEGFFVGAGHRLENDLEALGQGGISGMIGVPGTVQQATFKTDGDDNADDATEIGSNIADEQGNLLATYRALYEVKLRMEGRWANEGASSTDAAVDYPTAYSRLSAYEKSLVRPVLGDPSSTGEFDYRNINSEDQDFYNASSNGDFDVVSYTRDNNDADTNFTTTDMANVSRTASIIKDSTSSTDIAHRFGSLDRNEGYGSGKNMVGIAGDYGVTTTLTVIFGERDNDAATSGTTTAQVLTNSPDTDHDDNLNDVDEAIYGNIPTPSADEIEALRYVMAASGDGGSVRSIQGELSGNVSLLANTFDDVNTGLDLTQANARGIYINSNDAALSGTDLFAVVGHGTELIKARAGDAGLHHDTAVQVTASIGGDGGDAIIQQDQITGDILLSSNYVIDIQAENNALGLAEEDTRIGHQLKIGSHLEDFASGTQAAVVAGIGGQDIGLGGDTRNGSGGDVTITQGGAIGAVALASSGDIKDGEGLVDTDADGSVDEIAIRIFADNPALSADHTEVHVGHDQHIDSAQAGDAGRMHALNTYETNKGLIGVIEGKGGDITVTQAELVSSAIVSGNDFGLDVGSIDVGIGMLARDTVLVKGFISNGGKNRTLIGHDTTAGKEWQDGELDNRIQGNKLIAGIGGDSFVEMFDDVDGGEADSGTITVKQGTNNDNGTQDTSDDYYEALTGNIYIASLNNEVIGFNLTGNSGDTYVELGHQLKLNAETTEAGLQRGITDQTAGDGGDILVTRGRITGDIALLTDGRDVRGDVTTDTTDFETGADGNVLIDSKTGSGGTAELMIGHSSESILTTGRSGFSQEFDSTNYDGLDGAEDDAASSTQFIETALQEIAGKTVPNSDSTDTATLTNVDKRDAIRLITNMVAAFEMAQQYNDRLTTEQQDDLQAAIDLAKDALSDIGSAELADDATAYEAVRDAASQAATAYINGVSALNDGGNASGDGLIYVGLFGDHADGGDIRIDENDDLSAVDAAVIAGDVFIGGNVTEGHIRVTAGGGVGSLAVTELGHRLEIFNSTGEGAGETDGAPPDGGEAGDGGNIDLADNVSGNITLHADRMILTTLGLEDSLTHLGHDLDTDNYAGMADIFNNGLGNGGNVNTAQTASGDITLRVNTLTDALDAADTNTLTIGGTTSVLDIGHMADQLSESDDDGQVSAPGNSIEYNRAGDMVSSQTISGDVIVTAAVDTDLDTDLIIDASAEATNAIDIMHDGVNSAHSGVAGHGDEGDGQMVTVSQTISGDLRTNTFEDLKLTSAGGDLNIGHDGENTGISGQVNDTAFGDDYGERVDADQNISGEIALAARRTLTIENTGGSADLHVGHTGIQTAESADDGGNHDTEEGYRDGDDNLLIADVDADQVIGGDLSIVAGQIFITGGTSGGIHYGHEAEQNTATDHDTGVIGDAAIAGHQPGHIEANSSITGDMYLIADAVDDNNIGTNVGSNNTTTIIEVDITGSIIIATDISDVQFGHEAATNTGTDEAGIPNGSVNTEQSIISNIDVYAGDDLTMLSAAGGKGNIGHSIVENNSGMGTDNGMGHENTYLDADGTRVVSDASQRINGDIDVEVVDYLHMVSEGGDLQIGHESVENFAQIGVSDQIVSGDITVDVGTGANGTPNGDATSEDDDANIDGISGTVVVGHEITQDLNNEVQIASGDIWVRVGADLFVRSAQIGHVGYDFADGNPISSNSYDLDAAKAAALASGEATADVDPDTDLDTGDGVGTIRNRIQGNTTIGSAQNSPSEDSTLQADVMVFESALINSGYGGIANKDVDGELKFFLPAQEGLTIDANTVFNDSFSSGTDAVPARASSPENIFENEAGLDHEHPFELMSVTAAYEDDIIGPANFGFYFEVDPAGDFSYFTPYLTEITGDNGFELVYFDEETGAKSVINIGSLDGENYFGTSSMQVACEEAGLSDEECELILEEYKGQSTGLGSNIQFSANAGGSENIVLDLEPNGDVDPDFSFSNQSAFIVPQLEIAVEPVQNHFVQEAAIVVEDQYIGPVTITRKTAPKSTQNVVVASEINYGSTTVNESFNYQRFSSTSSSISSILSKDFEIVTSTELNGYSGSVVYGDPFDMSSSYVGSGSYGQYVSVGTINNLERQNIPSSLSFASSYLIFEEQEL